MADEDDEQKRKSLDLSMLSEDDQALYLDLKRRESVNHGQVRLSRQGGPMPAGAKAREAFLNARDANTFTHQDAATLHNLETQIYGSEQADKNAGLRVVDPFKRQRAEMDIRGTSWSSEEVQGANRKGMNTTWMPSEERRRRATAMEENRKRNHQAFLETEGISEDEFQDMTAKTAALRDWYKNYGSNFAGILRATTNMSVDDFKKLSWKDKLKIAEGTLGIASARGEGLNIIPGKYEVVSNGTIKYNPAYRGDRPDTSNPDWDWWRN